jgi:hypothetical protein
LCQRWSTDDTTYTQRFTNDWNVGTSLANDVDPMPFCLLGHFNNDAKKFIVGANIAPTVMQHKFNALPMVGALLTNAIFCWTIIGPTVHQQWPNIFPKV